MNSLISGSTEQKFGKVCVDLPAKTKCGWMIPAIELMSWSATSQQPGDDRVSLSRIVDRMGCEVDGSPKEG